MMPAVILHDMHDPQHQLTIEQNGVIDSESAGGVWVCLRDQRAGKTVTLDLTDQDATRLGEFLTALTR